jgi:predicted nucleic acid-binding protein
VILYTDTSALIKLFLNEPGTVEMRAAQSTYEGFATAAIGYVELRAALATAIRNGRIPPERRADAAIDAERLWASVAEVPIEAVLIRRAGDLAEQQRLRGYDAVHLAALQSFGGPGDVVFACWDDDLRRAARGLGYRLLPP